MRDADATSEPRHPIQVVSRRTGLSPDVIRVWERRYRAVSPRRSTTNRRLYSDDDLDRLLLLRRATLLGRAIGQVASLDTPRLRRVVEADESAVQQAPRAAEPVPGDPVAAARFGAALEAVRALDGERLRAVLHGAAIDLATPVLLQQLLVPLMNAVGDEWLRGSMRIHHEHLASALVRALLDALRESHARSFAGPEIVVTTPPEEQHELGALMASVVAAAEGWRVTYLGPNVPVEDLAQVAVERGARAVALSVVFRDRDGDLAAELLRLRRALPDGTALLLGGGSARRFEDAARLAQAVVVDDVALFRAELSRLRGADR
ncbi:MAG TPA: cobalamin B12-binding domain-containing protein [Candidatus Polarisedimenticolaceae bacterium]